MRALRPTRPQLKRKVTVLWLQTDIPTEAFRPSGLALKADRIPTGPHHLSELSELLKMPNLLDCGLNGGKLCLWSAALQRQRGSQVYFCASDSNKLSICHPDTPALSARHVQAAS